MLSEQRETDFSKNTQSVRRIVTWLWKSRQLMMKLQSAIGKNKKGMSGRRYGDKQLWSTHEQE